MEIDKSQLNLDSIEIKKNAKGKFSYSIKCYGEDLNVIIKKIEEVKSKVEKVVR